MKKQFSRLITLVALCGLTFAAAAQGDARFPERPIKLVVPSSAGSEPDTIARLVAKDMSTDLGQPFVVENRVGASGMIGVASVATSKPDGYTIGIVYQAVLALSPHLIAKRIFEPLTEIAPIGLISVSGNALLVPVNSPIRSYADFVARAKASPGTLTFASWGESSAGHISGEVMKRAAGIDIRHIPYKGSNEALMGMLGGEVDAIFGGWGLTSIQVKAGKVRVLAVTSPQRSPIFTDVPTFQEVGIPFGLNSWYGLVAPSGVPAGVMQRLEASLRKAVGQPEIVDRLTNMSMQPQSSSAAQLGERIRGDYDIWGKKIVEAGIKAR